MEKPDFIKYGAIRLPPGFRFHPTDEELVVQYLRRKAFSWPLPAAVIPEIDLGKYDPWDLPGGPSSVIQTHQAHHHHHSIFFASGCGGREGERYFFSLQEARYFNGRRHNRATISGYWKAAGKDRPIIASRCNKLVGLKKVLVFYRGKPPYGSRTDWIMHEYCLADPETRAFSLSQRKISAHSSMFPSKDWVVCRIFKKRRATRIDAESTSYYNYSQIQNNNTETIDPGPSLSSSSSSSSCLTDLSEDGEEGSSNRIASSPNGREM